MSQPQPLAELQSRYQRLLTDLDAAQRSSAPELRERLRGEIVALYRESESLMLELGRFKDQIRTLVSRFRSLATAAGATSRADHLGSSTFIDRGWNAIAAGEYDRAAAALRRALELAPGEPVAEVLLGWALMLRGDHDEAETLFRRVLASDPEHALARANLGYVCIQKRSYAEASEHLMSVLRQDSDRKAVLYANFYLGLLHLERQMYADAKSYLARSLELGPNLIEAWWELGRACYLDGSASDARRAWRHGAKANFSVWSGRCAGALARLEVGEPVSFG